MPTPEQIGAEAYKKSSQVFLRKNNPLTYRTVNEAYTRATEHFLASVDDRLSYSPLARNNVRWISKGYVDSMALRHYLAGGKVFSIARKATVRIWAKSLSEHFVALSQAGKTFGVESASELIDDVNVASKPGKLSKERYRDLLDKVHTLFGVALLHCFQRLEHEFVGKAAQITADQSIRAYEEALARRGGVWQKKR